MNVDEARKRANLRLGLMLAGLALVSFLGFLAKFFFAR